MVMTVEFLWTEVEESLPEFPECESLFVEPVGAT